MRVGGRIRRADVDFSTKHPVVLPGESSLAHRIVWQRHLDLMHAGTERVLADLRAEFWITGGRRLVRRVLGKCLHCRKLSAVPKQIMMSDLPSERLDFHAPAFTNVGIDFFGPFEVIVKRSREKRYGCIFTCLVSRAVHLELTPSLNLNSVIQAVKRFISRRGRPRIIMSDNGSSFVKAAKCLRREWSEPSRSTYQMEIFASPRPTLRRRLGTINWRGKKGPLCATLHGNNCTDEVLTTIFAEVEALLNGRPLCYIGEDPSNPEPLTPFMLLTGRTNINVPVDVTCDKECTSNKHWCYAQKIVDRFWQRWQKEYLPTLQYRSRWTKDIPNVKVGDVVIIVEPHQPRGHWPLGRITHIVEGTDGRVRIATVKTKNRSYVRPVTRLALIESLG
ncbi:hypothetical protein M514_13579 [Trichuris suis]|uniref:Integrase catalytic domain-containing protein n=1 Tax=Trichuris suis TaxID=68888 RepID=A0A085NPV5_9BILA|nr:hypothetical protein M514_13579 [Trichuris suis]